MYYAHYSIHNIIHIRRYIRCEYIIHKYAIIGRKLKLFTFWINSSERKLRSSTCIRRYNTSAYYYKNTIYYIILHTYLHSDYILHCRNDFIIIIIIVLGGRSTRVGWFEADNAGEVHRVVNGVLESATASPSGPTRGNRSRQISKCASVIFVRRLYKIQRIQIIRKVLRDDVLLRKDRWFFFQNDVFEIRCIITSWDYCKIIKIFVCPLWLSCLF